MNQPPSNQDADPTQESVQRGRAGQYTLCAIALYHDRLSVGAEGGYEFALRIVAERLLQDEGMDAAVAWLRKTPNGAAVIAELRHAEGDHTGAISAVLPLCEDDPTLVRLAGPWLVAAGRTDEAIALYQRVVAPGGAETPREAAVRESAVRNAAELLHGTARPARARRSTGSSRWPNTVIPWPSTRRNGSPCAHSRRTC